MYDQSAAPWNTQNPGVQQATPPPGASSGTSFGAQSNGLTVDDAWALFGIVKKRGTRDEVKRLYLDFAFTWHPDRHPGDEATAVAQLKKANLAWALLQKHCRW